MLYQIYGDYGFDTQNLLEEFNWLQEARDWLRGYTRWGDFGGYDNIYIVDKQGNIYQAVYAEEMV
jgi:outer membrane biogenesis lipoprotein LolB